MKRSLWGRGIRLSALVLALAAGVAGCVEPDPPSVAIAKKKASLVFGVTVNEPVKPITEQLAPLLDADLDDLVIDEEPEEINLGGPPAAPAELCPKAELTAVAEKIAGHNSELPMPVGSYRWARSGTIIQDDATFQIPLNFERRNVGDFVKVSDTQHTFKFRSRPVPSIVIEDTYRVITNGFSRGTTDGVNTAVQGPRVGENDRGLLWMHRRIINDKNQVVGEFAPQTGLLMLPLPVSPGEEWRSVAVDTKNGLTIIHQGKVTTTKRVDACGQVMDGWAVESTQTYVNGSGSSDVKYDYSVATQYGAMFLSERFRQTVQDISIDLNSQIGQAKPDPGT